MQVREHQKFEEWSTCLFLLRADGSMDDMSARKCIARLFPAWGAARSNTFSKVRTLQRLCAAHGDMLNIYAPCTLSAHTVCTLSGYCCSRCMESWQYKRRLVLLHFYFNDAHGRPYYFCDTRTKCRHLVLACDSDASL